MVLEENIRNHAHLRNHLRNHLCNENQYTLRDITFFAKLAYVNSKLLLLLYLTLMQYCISGAYLFAYLNKKYFHLCNLCTYAIGARQLKGFACFWLEKRQIKSTERAFQCLNEYQEGAGQLVQRSPSCFPLVEAQSSLLSVDIFDVLTVLFISYLYSIYPYLTPVYSLKRGVYHE